MKFNVVSSFLLIACAAFSLSAFSQGKARITIKKNEGGVITEEFREIEIDSLQNINSILQNLGVLDEFGILQDGQQFEISIDKFNRSGDNNLKLKINPDQYGMAGERTGQAFLGVMLKDNKPAGKNDVAGVTVTEVIEGSAAMNAGLTQGDIITEIDKTKITQSEDLINYIKGKKPGDQITVKYKRDKKTKTIKISLGERRGDASSNRFRYFTPAPVPDEVYDFEFDLDSIMILPDLSAPGMDSMKVCQPFAWRNYGMEESETAFLGVTPSSENLDNNKGVKVMIEPESSALKMGLQDNDVILNINGTPVDSFRALAEIIGSLKPGDEVNIDYERDGKKKSTSGELGSRKVSGSDQFRIFHDFKGMDEQGDYLYDYQFDMDAQDWEKHMEEMLRNLEEQQNQLFDEKQRIEEDLEKFRNEKRSVSIKISIAEIEESDKTKVNTNATPKLENKNDLEFDEISFFPNPGNGLINLQFRTPSTEKVKIMIFDAEGAIIFMEERSFINEQYKKAIDISDQPNGVYYLQIIQGNKSYSKKLIKSE